MAYPVQVYNVEDEDSPILGYPEFYGRSPKNSYREGLADWIRDQDDDARIASISLKDRAAIGLASKAKGGRLLDPPGRRALRHLGVLLRRLPEMGRAIQRKR